MKIAIVSKADQLGGGASRIATELTDVLLAAGYDAAHWLTHNQGTVGHPVQRLYGTHPVARRSIYLGHRVLQKLGAPELLPLELLSPQFKGLLDADVIHVHDITESLSPWSLRWLAARKPLIWTLHDTSPFTGGCINNLGCENYKTTCRACPQHGSWPLTGPLDLAFLLHRQKKSFAQNAAFTPVAPSRWMADMAESSTFFPRPRVISNGIDLRQFKTGDKALAKDLLGIDPARQVIALCAGDLTDERKGLRHALTSLRAAQGQNPYVLAIGKANATLSSALEGFDVRFTGFVTDRALLAACYRAADALLYCSMADNQPLTVMEAMACGTPVIGFATGGIPELVAHGINGYLVAPGDHGALAEALPALLQQPATLAAWSARSADRANADFGYAPFLASHVALYEELTRGR